MSTPLQREDARAAMEDLKQRTLEAIRGELSRLIYLASTRDYNSGRYVHEGLAWQFTQEAAHEALAACHQEVFEVLLYCSLEELTRELADYFGQTGERAEDVLRTWKRLEPYRVAVPLECDPLAADLLCSNLRVALAILEDRQRSPVSC